jgi:hypothetical protein
MNGPIRLEVIIGAGMEDMWQGRHPLIPVLLIISVTRFMSGRMCWWRVWFRLCWEDILLRLVYAMEDRSEWSRRLGPVKSRQRHPKSRPLLQSGQTTSSSCVLKVFVCEPNRLSIVDTLDWTYSLRRLAKASS